MSGDFNYLWTTFCSCKGFVMMLLNFYSYKVRKNWIQRQIKKSMSNIKLNVYKALAAIYQRKNWSAS